MNYPTQSAAACTPSLGQNAVGVNAIGPPSIEDRLQHLVLACERLSKIRSSLGIQCDRIASEATGQAEPSRVRPEPMSLSERLGDAIAYVHDSCNELEHLDGRLSRLLFSSNHLERAR